MLVVEYDVDYRLIYLRESEFQRRILDIYNMFGSRDEPPHIEEIIDQLWDIMLEIFLDVFKGSAGYEHLDFKRIQYIRDTGDLTHAQEFITLHAGREFFGLFERDIQLYLMNQQLMFIGDRCRRRHLYNAAIIGVW